MATTKGRHWADLVRGPRVESPGSASAAFAASAEAAARRAPRFAWKFWDTTPMAHGTAGIGDGPSRLAIPRTVQVASHPNVLVANVTHDPPTPLINALSVWLQTPDARLPIADVDGHRSLIFHAAHSRPSLVF